ncbi:helix-turn-helix domain-containing protein [Herbaspirillum rubrisubalbicans]|uniref:Transcriptional regulator n=1 Tax=Herbaspirillum rubrisubalbicans TaxID=80842 RepID=A0ABX9BZ74_9BURK|nr:helix-turn-helix transcriptional regulator [Herbaspirillum rubrisubalbicans]RAM63356.1 transcriptional regulator [Herbaspirillum rubrisubalbicans]
MSVFTQRLKYARLAKGLSQERLGVESGLDEMSASARMNRYEQGVRVPDVELVQKIASVLDVPVAYFYSTDDDEAELLLAFHRLPQLTKKQILEYLRRL